MKRLTALFLIALTLTLPLAGCSAADSGLQRYASSFLDVFDTVTTVTVYAPDEETAQRWTNDAHALLLEYHRLCDIYDSYDGLNNAYTINENAGVAPVAADERLIALLSYAKQMYNLTQGKMNVALGSVLSIWHDYREAGLDDPANASLPPTDMLEEAAKHTNIDDVVIDENARTVYLADPAMSLDLGAIAKGYAAQRVLEAMAAEGVTSMLLSVGGNVCGIGARADGKDWKVAVESPDGGDALCTVNVNGQCLVTSGSYQRYYTVNGVRYHHIIDPATLMPAAYFDSVTVLCADSGLADALSTALFILPLEDGQALAASLDGVEVFWVSTDGTQTMTDGFASRIIQN